jgi:hypothetical protein
VVEHNEYHACRAKEQCYRVELGIGNHVVRTVCLFNGTGGGRCMPAQTRCLVAIVLTNCNVLWV